MYLLVDIDKGGFIRSLFNPATFGGRTMVHRETRNMQQWAGCFDLLREASAAASELEREDVAILSLTDEGGGDAVWVRDEQREVVSERLRIWKGCYGAWPLRRLSS